MTGNKTGHPRPGLLRLIIPAAVIICLFSCGQVVATGPVWDLENRNFQSDLQQVRHLNGRFLALGKHGVVLESVDGVDWQHRDVMGCTKAYDIAYSGAAYLVVGEGPTGNVWWSDDLVTWNETVTPGGESLRGVLWDGSSFVAVGESGEIANSLNGQVWSAENSGVSETLNGIATDGQFYVAVGDDSTIVHRTTGFTWSSSISGITMSDDFSAVTFGGGKFVVSGGQGFTIASATVPLFWTQVDWTAGFPNPPADVVWSGSEFVIVGWLGVLATSIDGINWLQRTRTFLQDLQGIAFDGTRYVVVGLSGTILTTTNLEDWVVQSTAIGDIRGIASSGSLICGLEEASNGYQGFTYRLISTDGVHWNRSQNAMGVHSNDLNWTGDRFVGASDNHVHWSPDCASWNYEEVTSNNSLAAATGTGGEMIAVGGASGLYYNEGTQWYQALSPVSPSVDFRGVTTSGSVHIAVGGGAVVSSIDRANWADVTPVPSAFYFSVATDGQTFVAVAGFSVAFSQDGFYWSVVMENTAPARLSSVRFVGGQYVAFAEHSQFVSQDGQTWVEEPYGFSDIWPFQIYDAIESHGQLRAVGESGNILRFGHLFIDGFESGNTSAWTATVP